MALLGNWLWRSPENKLLQASIIRSDFEHETDGWNSRHFHLSTHWSLWKGISQITPPFLPHIIHSLGDGSKIRFWTAAHQLLSALFPRIYNLSPRKSMSLLISTNAKVGKSTFRGTLEIMKQPSSALYLHYLITSNRTPLTWTLVFGHYLPRVSPRYLLSFQSFVPPSPLFSCIVQFVIPLVLLKFRVSFGKQLGVEC